MESIWKDSMLKERYNVHVCKQNSHEGDKLQDNMLKGKENVEMVGSIY